MTIFGTYQDQGGSFPFSATTALSTPLPLDPLTVVQSVHLSDADTPSFIALCQQYRDVPPYALLQSFALVPERHENSKNVDFVQRKTSNHPRYCHIECGFVYFIVDKNKDPTTLGYRPINPGTLKSPNYLQAFESSNSSVPLKSLFSVYSLV